MTIKDKVITKYKEELLKRQTYVIDTEEIIDYTIAEVIKKLEEFEKKLVEVYPKDSSGFSMSGFLDEDWQKLEGGYWR